MNHVQIRLPVTAMRQDIENLLVWTYRDELPKRMTSSAEGIWDRIGYGRDQNASHTTAAQRYPHFGLPHPDAERIEKAVDALRPVGMHWMQRRAELMPDHLALLEEHMRERDWLCVETVPVAVLVRHHAIMGTRPAWGDESPVPNRTQPARGPATAGAVVGEYGGHGRWKAGAYCPLRWSPSPIEIVRKRAMYAAWRSALDSLVGALRGRLSEHEAGPAEAPRQPWLVRGKVASVVPDLTVPRVMRTLPERPERARAV